MHGCMVTQLGDGISKEGPVMISGILYESKRAHGPPGSAMLE